MESVLVKANLVNLSTSQYWLIFNGEKGMLDHEGNGHKAVVYKSHFPPLRHSVVQRHQQIHLLINHIYTKTKLFVLYAPTTISKQTIHLSVNYTAPLHFVRKTLQLSLNFPTRLGDGFDIFGTALIFRDFCRHAVNSTSC